MVNLSEKFIRILYDSYNQFDVNISRLIYYLNNNYKYPFRPNIQFLVITKLSGVILTK